MSTFPLRVGTPDGLLYEGDVARVVCRTISGDLAILPGHCNYCTALGMGEAHIVLEDGTRRNAACIGGMLSMMNGVCRVLATTWEWEEDIDAERAEAAKHRAEQALANGYVKELKFKDGLSVMMPRPPVHFSDYEQRDYVPTGRIGEDTDRVFMAMGYTEEEISQLRDKKTIL